MFKEKDLIQGSNEKEYYAGLNKIALIKLSSKINLSSVVKQAELTRSLYESLIKEHAKGTEHNNSSYMKLKNKFEKSDTELKDIVSNYNAKMAKITDAITDALQKDGKSLPNEPNGKYKHIKESNT